MYLHKTAMKVSCVLVVLAAAVSSAAYLKEFSELELQAYYEVKALFHLLTRAERADVNEDSHLHHRKQSNDLTYLLFAISNCRGSSTVRNVHTAEPRISPLSEKPHQVKLGTFSYANCADPNTEIVVPGNLSISPDPIHIPGIIVGSGTVKVKSLFGSPVKAQLEVWKEVFGVWVKAPCIDQFGSCNYDDFCQIVNPPTCPPELVKIGLNCKCPFAAGSWNVPPVAVNVTQSLPFPISGGVKARIAATYNGSLVTCLQVQFDLA